MFRCSFCVLHILLLLYIRRNPEVEEIHGFVYPSLFALHQSAWAPVACQGVHLRFQGWDYHNLVLESVLQLPPHQCLFQCLLQKCQRQHQRLPRVWLKLPYNGLRLRLVTITEGDKVT